MSNTGGMEELLLLSCSVPGAGLQGSPCQLQTCQWFAPLCIDYTKTLLTIDKISPNMGQKFGI